ncbi:class I SAM-dependent methyltransferase [Candidatus Babeliales bacterium]|nr:class I SAM-dependent methyltransferase [Candidatus Babeliales bacterium]
MREEAIKENHPCRYEFDEFVKGYRKRQDQLLWLSGESSEYFAKYKAQKLLEWLPELIDKKIKVLDYGCGDGVMASYIPKYFKNSIVYGTDPSEKSIREASQLFPDISFSVIKGETVPYDNEVFDLVFAAGVFHHIPFEEHKRWVYETFRVLKKDGIFVFFDINPLNPIAHYVFKTHPMDQSAKMLSPWYARKLFKEYGFVSTKFYCFFPHFLRWMRFIEPYIAWLPFGAHHACIVRRSK